MTKIDKKIVVKQKKKMINKGKSINKSMKNNKTILQQRKQQKTERTATNMDIHNKFTTDTPKQFNTIIELLLEIRDTCIDIYDKLDDISSTPENTNVDIDIHTIDDVYDKMDDICDNICDKLESVETTVCNKVDDVESAVNDLPIY